MKPARTRLAPPERKQAILEAALLCAVSLPYHTLSRDLIAAKAGCAPGTVSHYFSTMTKLRRAIMREAVVRGIAGIVADGLAQRDPQARKAAPDVQVAARQLLVAR